MSYRSQRGGAQGQSVIPITPVVKYLMIINVAVWVIGVIILQNWVLGPGYLFNILGLVPYGTVFEYKFWQPFTYLFFHTSEITHILFNMLLLWWVGSQIEKTMGSKKFLIYYLTCGVGAAFLYLAVVYAIYYSFGLGSLSVLSTPVVGASGAVFGLMLAFAIFHGEEIVYFFMIFPMKAKYFVGLLVLIEVFVLSNTGLSGPVANLAHLGGIVVGFIYLSIQTYRKKREKKQWFNKNGRNLRLVVDNDKKDPTYH